MRGPGQGKGIDAIGGNGRAAQHRGHPPEPASGEPHTHRAGSHAQDAGCPPERIDLDAMDADFFGRFLIHDLSIASAAKKAMNF